MDEASAGYEIYALLVKRISREASNLQARVQLLHGVLGASNDERIVTLGMRLRNLESVSNRKPVDRVTAFRN